MLITGIMVGPAILQPITGWLLDQHWTGLIASGVRTYEPDAFRLSFLPMLCWGAFASLLVFALKGSEKNQLSFQHCQAEEIPRSGENKPS